MSKDFFQTGDRLGNYELVKPIGSGAFGKVYLAQHELTPSKKVAIKVLNAQAFTRQNIVGLIKEARRVDELKHPNILEVIDYGLYPVPHIITPYCAKGTLGDRYPKGTMVNVKTVAKVVKQIAQALWYVHNKHIMHLDVKPANILVNEKDEILLADFGIATYRSSNLHLARGTASYMAPEVWQNHPEYASDQYSLAILTYELLKGEPPLYVKLRTSPLDTGPEQGVHLLREPLNPPGKGLCLHTA
jgi:serine/threonine protein kinase